ncbi:hypothetical protein D3C75_683690 [compost metagenome]
METIDIDVLDRTTTADKTFNIDPIIRSDILIVTNRKVTNASRCVTSDRQSTMATENDIVGNHDFGQGVCRTRVIAGLHPDSIISGIHRVVI